MVRIVRRLTLEEISRRIESFEKKLGMSFDEFEELFLNRRVDRDMVDVYYEWASLVHAYRGYMEEGELDYSVEELRDLTSEELTFLTPKRLELLFSLGGQRIESINNLARKTRRDVKNVYQDLKLLSKLGFVIFKKMGKRNVIPETLIEEITLLIR